MFGFVAEVQYLQGQRWAVDQRVAEITFANEHFHGDRQAAQKFLLQFRNQFDEGRIIKGATMAPGGPNNRGCQAPRSKRRELSQPCKAA